MDYDHQLPAPIVLAGLIRAYHQGEYRGGLNGLPQDIRRLLDETRALIKFMDGKELIHPEPPPPPKAP